MTPEQQSNWLRVPGWLTAMLIGPVVSCCALAQAASPVTFVLPPAQQAQFGAVASDPTIRPFITPGVPAGVFLSWSVDLQGNGRPDSVLCHGTFPPDPKVKQPCRVLRPQLDGAVLDVTRKLFGNGALPSVEHPRGFVTGDFNGDGRADIFVAAHGYDTAPFDGEINLLLLSNPNGTYSDRSSTLPQEPDFSHSACAADVNGDGRLDIFVNNLDGPVVPGPYFLLGNGDGTFTQTRAGLPASIVRTVGSAPPDRSLACGFVDADGDGMTRDAFYTLDAVSFDGTATTFNGLIRKGVNDNRSSSQLMIWSAGPDKKIDESGKANVGANKDNVLSWKP